MSLIRGERLLFSSAVVILSEAKNLGSEFTSIHKRKQSEMFLPRLRDQHDSTMTPNLFQ